MVLIRNPSVIAGAAVVLLGVGGADAADTECSNRDAQAEALLKKMSDYMGQLESFSAEGLVADEQIMGDGFKLTALRSGSFKVQRPDKFYMQRKGMVRDQEFYFDGSRLVVHGKRLGVASDLPVSGDIDAVLDTVTKTLGAELPAHDLVSADSYTPLMEPVEESAYLGVVEIGGVSCRHLAFRTDEVDWQLWVQEGERPLPCRYTITSKWTYGAPQYTVTFGNWQVNPEFTDSDFTFSPPEGTKSATVEEFIEMLKQAGNEP
jgi:hypothetical protein